LLDSSIDLARHGRARYGQCVQRICYVLNVAVKLVKSLRRHRTRGCVVPSYYPSVIHLRRCGSTGRIGGARNLLSGAV
jgi:hypothetical protein